MQDQGNVSVAADRLDEILDLCADVLSVDRGELAQAESFFEVGADSLLLIELVAQLDQRYGVEIPESEFGRLTTVSEVHRVVAERAGW